MHWAESLWLTGILTTALSCFLSILAATRILACCITSARDTSRIDEERLFGVMKELTAEFCPRLELDYGEPCPNKYWCSYPGGEIFVTEPTKRQTLRPLILSILANDKFPLPDKHGEAGAADRVTSDIFRNLPYDVICAIAELLPASSLMALSQAPRTLHSVLAGDSPLWRHCLSRELPRFCELIRLVYEPGLRPRLSFKMVIDWAQKVTKPQLDMRGPFLVVANCRRIWGICGQLARLYQTAEPLDHLDSLLH
jgi:hypothetical protein